MAEQDDWRPPTLPAHYREQQRKWLTGLELLDRPWLILGSAPSPTLPPELLRTHARVDINNAGRTADTLGLEPADLTFRKKSKPWSEHPALRTRGLIWYNTVPAFMLRLRLLALPQARVGKIMKASRSEREKIVEIVSNANPTEIGDRGKVTNGVAALCYALYVGVPQVVLTGMSLSKDGHSYNEVNRARRQIEEDAFILDRLKSRPDVLTTEPDLARDTGIRLWKPD
jgi:hypothetical protein